MRGCCWIALGALIIVIIVVLAYTSTLKPEIWCDANLNAGECEEYVLDDTCYCIDQKTKQLNETIGIYEHSKAQCQILNGSLAMPSQNDVLIWLSKRMYSLGINQAYIGLQKINTEWFWMKENDAQRAYEIHWRKDFPPDPQENHAVITVETLEIEDEEVENAFIYYNYDFYIEKDRNYGWYGFRTASNVFDPNALQKIYYICHYINKPANSLIQEATTPGPDVSKNEHKTQDPCHCSSNEQIKLKNLEESISFASPGYPNNYCSDNNCRWIVTTTPDLIVLVEWIVFSTEDQFDKVYIHDGEMGEDPLIATCTGNRCPDERSSGHQMHIHFSADHVTTDIGFKGRVTAIEPDGCYCSKSLEIILANEGDSYVLKSPNHPLPYCVNHKCSWVIQGPENIGLHLAWSVFELENRDFLSVWDGADENDCVLCNCTDSECDNTVSSSYSLHISFISDERMSSHKGFSGVVTAVPNYCLKELLLDALGSLVSSSERPDGNVPIGATARLTCNQGSKINGTIDTMSRDVTCTQLGWSDTPPACVPVCQLETETSSQAILNVCKVVQATDMNLVAEGHNVTVKKYNTKKHREAIDFEVYICDKGGVWKPKAPLCHASKGILILGGTYEPEPELFSPAQSTIGVLNIIGLVPRLQHVSVLMADGRLLLAGGSRREKEEIALSTHSDIIDLEKLEAVPGPPMLEVRETPAAAVLNEKVFVCGGQAHDLNHFHSSCEVLQNHHWSIETHMPIGRFAFGLVALNDCLFTIGGASVIQGNTTSVPFVHRYCPEKSSHWETLGRMIKARHFVAAAVLDGSMFVCGGELPNNGNSQTSDVFGTDSCEVYDDVKDEWMILDAKMYSERARHCMTVLDGSLFALGGAAFAKAYTDQTTTGERYDAVLGKWKKVVRLQVEREYSSVAVVPLMDWSEH